MADRPGLRPTPDRVRETLFNWLRQDLSGWRCLDAFAGSGALGLEAASRGAKHVVLVERDPVLAESLRRTIERLGAAKVEVVCGDGVAVLRRTPTASCDLVFIDPPYGSGMLEPALDAATRVVVPGGFAYAEDSNALQAPAGWGLFRHGRAGAVWFHLFQREGSFG